ncbi:hypothetical protein FYJ28_01415 [Arthrobacter sp. BL-252-APC-1A]|uniref:glycerophosphodiester phosphodiesterase family protein n=1 Tax=Arthrobacter sp. BL-252-APC-1A TaxID=2606622 RepID=UPI0012B2BFD8|nr:glycerophosphodiester phosphodiesterase family protein [Arthrobacter sp. BL-252-APC-1A]MSR97478.1 hypothetical protein [Arthrobacter sp. BL-252-APC-1A]
MAVDNRQSPGGKVRPNLSQRAAGIPRLARRAGLQEWPAGLRSRVLFPALLKAGWSILRRGGWRLLLVYALSQAVPLAIISPLIHWMFTEALAAAGVHAVDSAALASAFGNGRSLGWIAAICVLAVATVSLQLSVLVVAAGRVRSGLSLGPAALFRGMLPVLKRLPRLGSLPLGVYLFLVVPLTQAGLFSVLTHSIAVPNFVSGEMLKSTPGTLAYVGFLMVVGTLALRYSLAVPFFALGGVAGGKAMRLSWQVTSRTTLALLAAGAAATAGALLAGAALVFLSLLPTLAADLFLPAGAARVAAYSLGTAQVAGVVLAGSFVMFIAGMLIELTERSLPLLPGKVTWHSGDDGGVAGGTADSAKAGTGTESTGVHGLGRGGGSGVRAAATSSARHGTRSGAARAGAASAAVVLALILGTLNIPVMEGLREVPQALILGHRGFSGGGAENTISGLRAASSAGADMVEMDVMQTSDGGFVVMHDASLQRLAGRNAAVADLTLAELTSMTVQDQFGHTDLIPSLTDYVRAAQEIGEPLLIEMKMHGGETEDYVERLVAELESLEALEENIYHSLDKDSAEELKRLRPGLYVGLTMAVAGVAAPETTADFIVVEEASYTDAVRESAWKDGKEFYVWTVNGPEAIRNMLRDGVDGIITDHPDLALQDRNQMGPNEPMSSKLYDALMRFVVIF